MRSLTMWIAVAVFLTGCPREDPPPCDDDATPCDDDDDTPGDDDDATPSDDDDVTPTDDDDATPTDDDDSAAGDDDDTTPPPEALPVAIYDDTAEADPSAWDEGLQHIEDTLGEAGLITGRITRSELNDDPMVLDGYGAVVFGGGFAYPGYTLGISPTGKQRLRDFVDAGGGYVGICAGAYFACAALVYEGEYIDDESGYDLDLFDGVCFGPVADIASYPYWDIAEVAFPGHGSYEAFATSPFATDIWYGGGPYFQYLPPGAEIVATYDNPGIEHHGTGAVLIQEYGDGHAVLWGPHPELPDWPVDASSNRALFAEVIRWAATPDQN